MSWPPRVGWCRNRRVIPPLRPDVVDIQLSINGQTHDVMGLVVDGVSTKPVTIATGVDLHLIADRDEGQLLITAWTPDMDHQLAVWMDRYPRGHDWIPLQVRQPFAPHPSHCRVRLVRDAPGPE